MVLILTVRRIFAEIRDVKPESVEARLFLLCSSFRVGSVLISIVSFLRLDENWLLEELSASFAAPSLVLTPRLAIHQHCFNVNTSDAHHTAQTHTLQTLDVKSFETRLAVAQNYRAALRALY